MFRRARWLGAGAALGFGASVWAQHKLKAAAARYRAAGVAGHPVNRARAWPSHLRAAIDEGRSTMRAREAELRDGLVRPPAPSNNVPGPGEDRPSRGPRPR